MISGNLLRQKTNKFGARYCDRSWLMCDRFLLKTSGLPPMNIFLPRYILDLFHYCNSANYCGKSTFYWLKPRVLKRFGEPDGWDIQQINKECWGCYGDGCHRCDGTGIYYSNTYWLLRFRLGDRVYHQPSNSLPSGLPNSTIHGKVRHPKVVGIKRSPERALLILMLWFEPFELLKLALRWFRLRCARNLQRLKWKLIDWLQKSDGIPF